MPSNGGYGPYGATTPTLEASFQREHPSVRLLSPDLTVFRGRSGHDIYRDQLATLLRFGSEVMVKGRPTRELLNAVTIIEEPRRRTEAVPGRRANPWLALSEAIWLLAGQNDVASLAYYNRRIKDYSDDGLTLYGAYGYRLHDQIAPALERLRREPDDRRVVLAIWRPEDLTAETRDPPCNNLVAFKLRDGCLHMTVFCRSNDLHWGLHAVNLCQFSLLQEYMAVRLGAALGSQTHYSQSLHVYGDGSSADITRRMLAATDQPLPELPEPASLTVSRTTHAEFVEDCRRVLAGLEYGESDDPFDGGVPFLEFVSDFLGLYGSSLPLNTARLIRHGSEFGDWLAAAYWQ